PFEHSERAADQVHENTTIGLQHIARGELALQRAALYADGRDDFLRCARLHFRVRAPGQELWITFDIVDEREQQRRRLADERRVLNFSHSAIVACSGRLEESSRDATM